MNTDPSSPEERPHREIRVILGKLVTSAEVQIRQEIYVSGTAMPFVLMGLSYLENKMGVAGLNRAMEMQDTNDRGRRFTHKDALWVLFSMNELARHKEVPERFNEYRSQLADAIVVGAYGYRAESEPSFYADSETVWRLLHDQTYMEHLLHPSDTNPDLDSFKSGAPRISGPNPFSVQTYED